MQPVSVDCKLLHALLCAHPKYSATNGKAAKSRTERGKLCRGYIPNAERVLLADFPETGQYWFGYELLPGVLAGYANVDGVQLDYKAGGVAWAYTSANAPRYVWLVAKKTKTILKRLRTMEQAEELCERAKSKDR